jgi:cephalosporin-C deacetylase-like acetyl esterase
MKVNFDKTNATYGLNEPVTIRTTFFNNSFDTLAATLIWQLKPEFLAPIDSFEQAIVVPVGTTKTFSRSFNCTREGLYQITTQVKQNQTLLLETEHFVGYAMHKLRTKLTGRTDFQNFWLRTRQQLSLIPLQMKIERIDSLENPLCHAFKVRLLSFDDIYIFGTYLVPKKIGKFPIILEIQNFDKPSSWLLQPANSNFAIFSLYLRNREHATNVQDPDLAEYLLWNVDNKEKYFFRGVIMDAVRAVDFLISRPEIDTTRLAIVGESLGAGVAFAVAALDARVKLVAIDVPLLTAFETATKYVVYPYHDIIQYVVDNPQQKKDTFDTLSYFDLINFANLIHCPVLLGIGLKDTISPPLTSFLLYNYIRAEKSYRVYPTGGHEDTPGKHWKTKVTWLKTKCNLND